MNSDKLDNSRRSIKFDYATHGGDVNRKTWTLWRDRVNIVDIKWDQQQFTCKFKSDNNNDFIWYTFVYAKCRRADREQL